jgi:hypothetical protein
MEANSEKPATTNGEPASGIEQLGGPLDNTPTTKALAQQHPTGAAHNTWRDLMPVHPAADLFPMLCDADLVALGEDIEANGLITPIMVDGDYRSTPTLCDGRNRLAAMERVGIPVRLLETTVKRGGGRKEYALVADGFDVGGMIERTIDYIDCDPVTYIVSANIHRRHLTAETKRGLVAELLKENPERSDRATAALIKVDHKTVAAVRRREEDVGSIPHVEKRVDTKGRHQPTRKGAALPKADSIGPKETSPVVQANEPSTAHWDEAEAVARSPSDPAEAANLAVGLRVALSGIGPILDRIEAIGPAEFWRLVGTKPAGRDLRHALQAVGVLRDLKDAADVADDDPAGGAS